MDSATDQVDTLTNIPLIAAGFYILSFDVPGNLRRDRQDAPTALFGDLTLAASFGDRRQTTIQISEHATVGGGSVFEQDELAVRGTERFDINVHDTGITGASGESGPIVGLRLDVA